MKSVKQKLIDDEIDFYDSCTDYYNELTQEDVDFIVEEEPWLAAGYLNKHPLLKQEHVNYIVEKASWYAAKFLNQHSLLTQKHVDYIVKKEPWDAATYLSHKLSEENIVYIAEKRSDLLKEVFK